MISGGAAVDVFLDVFDGAPERQLAPGDILIHAGGSATEVFNIRKGMLMVSRIGRDGRRQVLSFLFPDNFVGLTASDRYYFTVEAVTPSIVVSRPRTALDTRLAADPAAELAFRNMVFRVLENLVDLAYSLGQRTARERLAVFMLYLRHRHRQDAEVMDDTESSLNLLALPMSREDIADFLGLKKETVSRSFRQLEQHGLIERHGSHAVHIRDLSALRDLAGPQVYNTACLACHGAGIGGAPILGDADAWSARISQGDGVLNDHALNGYQGSADYMPPKGGRADPSDDEIIAAVEYMVEQSR